MQMVVLAGGLATRTRPEAEQIPKSLLMVNGRPFVDWQLDRFVACGARQVVMCVGYLGEQIETHVKRALDRRLTVGYSYDGAELVGTGGALRRAFARLESEFVLTYGDSYLPFDYAALLADLQAQPDALGTMCVQRSDGDSAAGNVALDGAWIARYEPNGADPALDHTHVGAVALRRSVFEGIEEGAVWGIEALFRKLARQRKLRAFVAPEPCFEVASPEGLARLAEHLTT
jgi:N-acetyl-alpha-D-muramate 1-phosphate uridylyltransferase